jgi:hypothetical protein
LTGVIIKELENVMRLLKILIPLLFLSLTACEDPGAGGSDGSSSSGVIFKSKGRYSVSPSLTVGYRHTENMGCATKLIHADYEDTILYLHNDRVYLFQYIDDQFKDVTPENTDSLYDVSSVDLGEVTRVDVDFNGASMSEGLCASYGGTPNLDIILANEYFVNAVLELAVNGITDSLYNIIEIEAQ